MRLLAWILLPIVLYVGYLFVRHTRELQELKVEAARYEDQVTQLEDKQAALYEELEISTTDSYVERVVREVLGWIKPGDIRFVDPGGQ